MTTIDFEKECPNCFTPWDIYKTTICSCGLHANVMVDKIISVEIYLLKANIVWYNTGVCIMYPSKGSIHMPWLPFDVTEEQLKLYLTFL